MPLQATLGADRVGLLYVDGSTDFWAAAASAQRAESNGIKVSQRNDIAPRAASAQRAECSDVT